MAVNPFSSSDATSKIVEAQFVTTEERGRRLQVAVDRLAKQSPVERVLWLDRTAEEHGIEPAKLKAMIDATIKEDEKRQRAQKAEERQSEQRAERQRIAAQRTEERQQREQQRALKEADKEAEKKQREREQGLAGLLKLARAEHEVRLATLAERFDEDLNFLREELGKLIAVEEEASAIASVAPWPAPVATVELLNEVQAQIARFVVIHDDAMVTAVVLWIAFAWIHEIAVHSPLLGCVLNFR